LSRAVRCDVVVVGAGLSGLHAAQSLEASGCDVQVVEALDRVGGRIQSMRQLGRNAEAGGTYIGARYQRLFTIIKRLGLQLIDVTPILQFFREQDLVLQGEIISSQGWHSHPRNPFLGSERELLPWNFHRVLMSRDNPLETPADWLATKYASLDISMHAWLSAKGYTDAQIKLIYGLNVSFGEDAHDVSVLQLLFRGAFSRSQRDVTTGDVLGYTIEGGVQQIPDLMAEALSRKVKLCAAVNAIESRDDEVEVHCVDGTRFICRHVIVSLPPGPLRSIRFAPALPVAQSAALSAVPSQPLTQVYLGIKRPFWQDDGHAASMFSDSLCGMLAAARSADAPDHVTHLTAWVQGRNALMLDRVDARTAGQMVIADIESLRPAAEGALEFLGMQSWSASAYAQGAWVYFKPGQVHRHGAALGLGSPRVHFCGEHLARDARGMEGALESAERCVSAILR